MNERELLKELRALRERVAELERTVSYLDVREARVPRAFTPANLIPTVASLPAIPTTTDLRIVLWGDTTLISGGDGDNQMWSATKGDTVWRPQTKLTNKSGAPG